MSQHDHFRYLNSDGRWPNFTSKGLDLRPDGAWQLATVPRYAGRLPAGLESLLPTTEPAGLAIVPDGTLYYSLPEKHQIMRIDSCDKDSQPMPCLDGHGHRPTQLSFPRGLAYYPGRQAVVVADTGNHRLQFFDLESFQLRDVWTDFHYPLALAADADGYLYAVDDDGLRVRKYDLRGNHHASFSNRLLDSRGFGQVVAIDVVDLDQGRRVILLDRKSKTLIIADEEGNWLHTNHLTGIDQPQGLIVSRQGVYVGDNQRRRLFKFIWQESDLALEFVGAAMGYQGPVSALAIGLEEQLWLLPGGDYQPLEFSIGRAHVGDGWLWGGPFVPESVPVHWQQVKAFVDRPAGDAHIQLFAYTADDDTAVAPSVPLGASGPWQALPLDVADAWIPGQAPDENSVEYFVPARQVWLAIHFSSDGFATPVLHQLRVSYDQETLRRYLPPIFGHDRAQRELLDKLLSLFQSFYTEVELDIALISRLFDPQAAPAEWLPWLAGWLDLQLDERWPEEKQREEIANALSAYAQRGTVSGLRDVLRRHAGVDARIEEPLVDAGWWMLPDPDDTAPSAAQNACLGFTTMLVAAEADGAVVGSTATLDRSHLIAAEDWGAPLFQDMAYRFTVKLHRGQAEMAGVERIRTILDREKPAHTVYHLCLIEPKMRIGFQARLGIDAIVAGPASPIPLGQERAKDEQMILGGEPAGRMDGRSQVGRSARLAG